MSDNRTRWLKDDPPNTLLAIDPGFSDPVSKVPYAGVALFQWGQLAWGGVVKCPANTPPFRQPFALVDRVCRETHIPRFHNLAGRQEGGHRHGGEPLNALAVEKPIIYVKGAARPQDIVDLRGIWGAFMSGIEADEYFGPTPGEWKGSVDKAVVNERAMTILSSIERILLMRSQAAGLGGLSDHAMDAVGIGLFTLGRCGKACVV